jgi:hypothetical protein
VAGIYGDEYAQEAILHDPQQLNSYAYSRNNPISNVDTTGNYVETVIDVISFALSLQEAYRHRTFWNGALLGLDAAGLVLPVPAVAGYIKHGPKALRVEKYFSKIAQRTGVSAGEIGKVFLSNATFKFSARSWTSGEAGSGLANLVGHYVSHGDEVGASNVQNYYDKANDFIGSGARSFADPDPRFAGDTIYYDPATHQKAIVDSSGSIKSYYVENRTDVISTYDNIISQ